MRELEGKIAIVTGGIRGIGRGRKKLLTSENHSAMFLGNKEQMH